MIVVMNVVRAVEGRAEDFERAFLTRERLLNQAEGFRGFELLRRDKDAEYVVLTKWDEQGGVPQLGALRPLQAQPQPARRGPARARQRAARVRGARRGGARVRRAALLAAVARARARRPPREAAPKRIVALTPFTANTVADLGVRPVAIGQMLGGDDRWSPRLRGVPPAPALASRAGRTSSSSRRSTRGSCSPPPPGAAATARCGGSG